MRIRIRTEDKLFSDYIRTRDKWTCQRCKKKYDPSDSYSKMGIHCSHFHGRGKKSTRFDPVNAVALCYGCHAYFHANPLDHTDWFERRIGKKEFDLLTLRANTPKKPDIKLIRIWLKLELNRMKREEEKDESL